MILYIRKILFVLLFCLSCTSAKNHQIENYSSINWKKFEYTLLEEIHKKPLIIYLYSTNDKQCLNMDKTLNNHEIINLIGRHFTITKIDTVKYPQSIDMILNKHNKRVPAFIILNSGSTVEFSGYVNDKVFLEILLNIVKNN